MSGFLLGTLSAALLWVAAWVALRALAASTDGALAARLEALTLGPRAVTRRPGLGERVKALTGKRSGPVGVGAAAGALAVGGPSLLLLVGIALGLLWGLPRWRALRAQRQEADACDALVPFGLDLLGACLTAGLGVRLALARTASVVPEPLGTRLRNGVHALDVGCPAREAYSHIANAEDSPDLAAALAALAHAEAWGAPLTEALSAQATRLRDLRRARAAGRARRAGVQVLFPLAACFLPAFLLLTVFPIVLGAARVVGPSAP
ncbi:MAG: type II secretion system F family protein [Actinomycetota bacterium]